MAAAGGSGAVFLHSPELLSPDEGRHPAGLGIKMVRWEIVEEIEEVPSEIKTQIINTESMNVLIAIITERTLGPGISINQG